MVRGNRRMGAIDDETGELLKALLGDYSDKRAIAWLERKFDSFDTSKAKELSVDGSKNEKEHFKSARILGYVRTLQTASGDETNRPVLVASVAMRKDIAERSSRQIQFNLAKRILQEAVRGDASGLEGYPSQGIFFFHDRDQFFRLSLVSGEMEGRRFKFNEAKRQSFYINPDRPNNIACSRLNERIATFADLKDAFSVESLTKEFYSKLFGWYEWAMDPRTGVTFPNDDADDSDDRKYNNEAIIRLITRLMFTWFIRQRGLVRDELFAADGVGRWIRDFKPTSMEEDNYYRCILQNLFFATFNCRPGKRGFVQRAFKGHSDGFFVKTRYRYEREFTDGKAFTNEMLRSIPFLNCALFDCLDRQVREEEGGGLLLFDGFSDTKKRQAHVPNGLFFDPERGIIPLFDLYEFTIDENNADDADVALDPELLGKVFENLLGAFNPETEQTARNATGSFYTPREIVDYMVSESLKNYLKTKVPSLKAAWLDDLFDAAKAAQTEALPFDDEVAAEVRNALYACKILDPACGSGAFPMGILHCMVRLFRRLDPKNTDLNDRIIKRYRDEKSLPPDPMESDEERRERMEAIEQQLKDGQHYPDYVRKLYLIENCIYGVDIQPIATQISKLRFFISLLCDQLRNNWNADADNAGLLSLPNLEAKFVCANTLISLPRIDDELGLKNIPGIDELREKLQENRHKIFSATTYRRKQALKEKDLEIRDRIREAVRSTMAKPDKDLIRVQRELIATYEQERKPYETPKMVKRKKPVQQSLFGDLVQEDLGFEEVDLNKAKRDEIDTKIADAKRKIASEEAKAHPSNVTLIDKLANLVAGWDPYDQNASSSFFDPKWMLNIEDGFDIVIGNPPYVQLQADGGKLAKMYQDKGFKTFIKTGDLYCLFYERGWQLSGQAGTLCYITSNKWMRAGYGQSLRRFFAEKTNPCLLIDFAGEKIFESASVDTNILMLGHGANRGETLSVVATAQCRDRLSEFVTECASASAYETGEPWLILSAVEKKLSESLKKGTPLGELGIQIYRGILSGLNEAFNIDEETRNEILSCCADSAERQRTKKILKPLVRGRDIARYGKNWAGLYLVGMHNGNGGSARECISQYPSLKRFMDRFKIELSQRSDKGDTPYNLRDCVYWEDFDKPKLIWADIMRVRKDDAQRFPRFSYCDEGYYANNSCYIAVGEGLKYILGVLNSTVGRYQCYKEIVVLDNGGFRMWKEPVERLRIPKVALAQQQPIVTLVDRILAAKKADPDADTSALEAEIDQLVYKLYGLTEEEIAVVEGREQKKAVEAPVPRRRAARLSTAAIEALHTDDDEELE